MFNLMVVVMNLKKKFPEIYAKIEAIGTNK